MADIIEIIKAADAATAAIKAERAKKAKAARENRKKTGSLAIGRKRPFEEVVDASNAEPAPAIPLEVIKDAPRPQKYRRHVTKLIAERIERACKQRMFLLAREQQSELKQAFTVLGNSQKVYTVTICDIPTCTCMDKIFNRDIHCKHVLFVMIKVLRVPHNNPLIWQRALVPSELRAIFAHATPDLAVAGKEASRKAKRAGLLLKKQKMLKRVRKFAPTVIRRPIEGDCPICYEELVETDSYNPILWCQLGCGNNLHRVCFNQWKKMKAASNKEVTCVYCRKSWMKDHNPKKEETASKPVREISNALH
ncbi:hypothetical protein BDF22DRAFT_694289 [Syncephalis plumigaleata]|nr:hypothetical protein BDF22DRAFT_694289 [Syncephalis plumigaleata]